MAGIKAALLPALKGCNHLLACLRARRWIRRQGRPASLPAAGRTLILAPHMDDEVIGCGGLIRLRANQGGRVVCVYLTDGAPEGCGDQAAIRRIRRQESRAAAACLGLGGLYFLEEPDGRLAPHAALEAALLKILAQERPDQVFLPTPFDPHPDHQAVAGLLAAVRPRLSQPEPVWFLYQIQAPLPWEKVTAALDITAVAGVKRQALGVYVSQPRVPFDVIWHWQCCQRYLAGPGARAAEVFRIISGEELAALAGAAIADVMQVKRYSEVGVSAIRRQPWI